MGEAGGWRRVRAGGDRSLVYPGKAVEACRTAEVFGKAALALRLVPRRGCLGAPRGEPQLVQGAGLRLHGSLGGSPARGRAVRLFGDAFPPFALTCSRPMQKSLSPVFSSLQNAHVENKHALRARLPCPAQLSARSARPAPRSFTREQ